MRILLAIDDSPYSQAAVEAVGSSAWAKGAAVRVLSVVRPVDPMATELWYAPAIDIGAWEEDMEKRARELVTRVAGRLGTAELEVDSVVRKGDPRTAIVDEAAEWYADLIVVGSHGYTGVKRLLLGSVAQYVVSHANCSVQVVRPTTA